MEVAVRFRDYQRLARKTDQVPDPSDIRGIIVPLLGLAGESGSLLSEYKKHLRDGDSYRLFGEHLAEELGDILWYVANIATKFGFDLEDLAVRNLEKVVARWDSTYRRKGEGSSDRPFDDDFPASEQLPRSFKFVFKGEDYDGRSAVSIYLNSEQRGDFLTDNAYCDDGYRFHDVVHIAFMAILGWSPVMRKILNCKRKSIVKIDEVEDGGRAAAIEEGISALVFDYARKHSFLEGIERVDFSLLRQIKDMTSHLEVRRCSWADWERAILDGYSVWREIKEHNGGIVEGSILSGKIAFRCHSRT